MLDIKSLRLTDQELRNTTGGGVGAYDRDIADAQLKKALLGIHDWLESYGVAGFPMGYARFHLRTQMRAFSPQLLAAGMARPKGD